MIVPDINMLVYAYNERSPLFQTAKEWYNPRHSRDNLRHSRGRGNPEGLGKRGMAQKYCDRGTVRDVVQRSRGRCQPVSSG